VCCLDYTSLVLCYVVGPSRVQLNVSPAVLQAGRTANMTCISDASNPAARLSWWKTSHDARPDTTSTRLIDADVSEWQMTADHGGTVVVSQLKLDLTADDDWMTVECLANATATVSSQLQLRVRCKLGLYIISLYITLPALIYVVISLQR